MRAFAFTLALLILNLSPHSEGFLLAPSTPLGVTSRVSKRFPARGQCILSTRTRVLRSNRVLLASARPSPKIAVIGRPNVGKSALVNRLCGSRSAIVADESGVTRDRTTQQGSFGKHSYCCVDTGGLVFDDSEGVFIKQIRDQAMIAIDESEAVIMVVDGQHGLHAMDQAIAEFLRKEVRLPVYVAVNKCESEKTGLAQAADFYQLGLGEPQAVSALHGVGTAELLERVFGDNPKFEVSEDDNNDGSESRSARINVSIVGKPNCGKSSILNTLTKSQRAIVSEVAGTTRDALDEVVERNGKEYRFVDCAGVRKRGKVDFGVEFFMVNRVLRSIRRSDVVLLVIDATVGVTEQDKRLAQHIYDQGKGIIVVCNKWDLVDKDETTYEKSLEYVREELSVVRFAPIIFTSALSGKRIENLYALVDKAVVSAEKRYPTSVINEVLRDAIFFKSPPAKRNSVKGKIYYAQQVSVNPPTIVVFCNNEKLIPDSYQRYLDKRFRESLPGYEGTPIRWFFRGRRERDVERKGNANGKGTNYPFPNAS